MSEAMYPAPIDSEPHSTEPAVSTPAAPAIAQPREGYSETSLSRLTLADGVLLCVAALAAILRFVRLDAIPLGPSEAAEALAVWQLWQPDAVSLLSPASPAYFTLTSLLTQFLGDGDAVMRFIPALVGTLLVLVPGLLRRQLGNIGAIVVALLIAVSPAMSIVARTAGGDSLALFAAVLMVTAWIRWREQGEDRWFLVATAALGFGLATAPLFYNVLLTLGVTAILGRMTRTPFYRMDAGVPGVLRRNGAIVGISCFIGASTLFLWYPAGLGASFAIIPAWLQQFGISSDIQLWLAPFLAIARYEATIILLGSGAIAWGAWRGTQEQSLLIFWFTAALLVTLAQGGVTENLLLLLIPGYLLIGLLFDDLFQTRTEWQLWTYIVVFVGLLLIAVVNLGRYSRVIVSVAPGTPFLENPAMFSALLALLALAAALSLIALAVSWNPMAALQVIVLGTGIMLLLFGWGTSWWLGQEAANDPRERWVAEGTDDDIRPLLQTLDNVAQRTRGDFRALSILSTVDSPALRWYLRDFNDLEFGETVPTITTPDVIITPADNETLGAAADYTGGDFGLTRAKLPAGEQPLSTVDSVLRWWLFHESDASSAETRVILWLRASLITGQ